MTRIIQIYTDLIPVLFVPKALAPIVTVSPDFRKQGLRRSFSYREFSG